jgi:hypothetical protein
MFCGYSPVFFLPIAEFIPPLSFFLAGKFPPFVFALLQADIDGDRCHVDDLGMSGDGVNTRRRVISHFPGPPRADIWCEGRVVS